MRSTERHGSPDVTDLTEPGEKPVGPPGVLGRTLALLESFDARVSSLSLGELSRRSGLPKSTVHRMVTEMCHERMLEREDDGTYRLGLRLFEIGERVPTYRSLSEAARPIMEDLREATRQRIHLAVLEGVDVVYVEIVGAGLLSIGSRTGGRFPAHATGVGKALLAYSPASVVQARIDAGLPRLTARTITTPGALHRDLRQARTRGFAQDREESHVGVSCVAAPVFGTDSRLRAALSITGRTTSIDPAKLGPAVLTAAHTLGRALRESHL
ncbi:IclR family transcriptional regulator [Intrasporangium sp.]|uniref:IclR family transcriptional regulator n=1 Tax=Intrasporangium sp. TaxID=1925024 RepID=UPI00293AE517|nr:IclR family transcriptional regulator [Intrasporangium sp.]MDV3223495.1 IclR family transcriptional regulator [Intrasporangium sp.]